MAYISSRWLLTAALTTLSTALLLGCNKSLDDTSTPPVASTTLGNQVDDTVVTAGVKSALLADPLVKSFDLKVETRKGVVLLSGFVDSQSQIDQAVAVTRGVSGVGSVENSVALKSATTTAGTRIDDSTVTGRVKTALMADPEIKSFDISVATVDGTVQLSGFVNNQAQIDRAAKIARDAEGSNRVNNELMIKR